MNDQRAAGDRRRRLYVSDLDGTLLDGKAKLSDFARSSLSKMFDAGVAFTVATARSTPAVKAIFGDLLPSMPIIEQNGACVTDLRSGRHLVVHDIPTPVACTALELFRQASVEPVLAYVSATTDRLAYETPGNVGTRWYIDEKLEASDPRLEQVKDVACALDGQVLSLTTLASEGTARQLAGALLGALGDRVQIRLGHNNYVPGFWELSLLDARATKSAGIKNMQATLGMADYELVVFGDAENDTDMFLHADISVAVGNAVPELRALATHVTATNEADGVIHWLLEAHGERG